MIEKATPIKLIRVKFKASLATEWETSNPLPLDGEICIVKYPNMVRRIKIGDGVHYYNELPFFEENGGSYMGFADANTVPVTNAGPVWYWAGPNTYYNFLDVNGNPIVVSGDLAIISFKNGYWEKKDILNRPVYTLTRIVVRSFGSVGVNCDFTNITDALQFVIDEGDNTYYNRYVIEVVPGYYSEAGINGFGLEMVDYVDIIGRTDNSSNKVVEIIHPAGPSAGVENQYFTITAQATCNIKNVRLISFKGGACIRANDGGNRTRIVTFENVETQNFGGNFPAIDTFVVMYYSQQMDFINCRFYGTGVTLATQSGTSLRNNDEAFRVTLSGCVGYQLLTTDYLCYSRNTISVASCHFDLMTLSASLATYNANPGSVTANRGFLPPLMAMELSSSTFDTVAYTGDYLTVSAGRRLEIPGYNLAASNTSGSNIPLGYLVKRDANGAIPNAYTVNPNSYAIGGNRPIHNRRFSVYTGTGKPVGFIEGTDLANNATGYMRLLQGEMYLAFDAVNGLVAVHDALEITAAGKVAKKSAGVTFAFCRIATAMADTHVTCVLA